jgi:L-seryl-tRNA(Ser) seleniumtransferase
LLATPEYIKRRAEKFIEYLEGSWSPYRVRILEGTSQVGGGTMPDVELPTFLIGLSHPKWNASALARKLRLEASPAVIVRIQQEEVQIDLRTVKEEEEKLVVEALKAFCS